MSNKSMLNPQNRTDAGIFTAFWSALVVCIYMEILHRKDKITK